MRILFALVALILLSLAAHTQAPPSRDEALAGMRKAVAFYVDKVSTEGGYHYYYAEDLSYGRSEQGEGPTQIEVQREATPRVGMAFLEAYDATGDRFYLEAARRAARALDFKDAEIHEAARFALDRLLTAQCPNGTWCSSSAGWAESKRRRR